MGFGDNAPGFDEPEIDTITGEIIEQATEVRPVEEPTTALAVTSMGAIDLAAGDLAAFTGGLRRALSERIEATAAAARAARPVTTIIGTTSGEVITLPPTQAQVAAEINQYTDLYEVLAAIGKVFADQSLTVRQIAGEVVQEVEHERDVAKTGGSVSVKVGSRGGNAKVTVNQATETFVDEPVLTELLVGEVLDAFLPDLLTDMADSPGKVAVDSAALSIRGAATAAISRYRELLAAPKFKVTALDAWRNAVQARGQLEIGEKINRAYGKRPVGNPSTKLERIPAKD